ncbi:MAG: hypothetical protein HYY26_01335 [Acidobacteria bacterium]|nr:hypothetical protein [Acidobacteriota bacterium]
MTNTLGFFLWLAAQATPPEPQFFDKDTLFTPSGATAAVILVTSLLQRLSARIPARWFALGFSLLLMLLAITVRQEPWSWVNILLAVLNGLAVYAAAVGVNTAVTAPPPAPAVAAKAVGAARSYRWWA